jgi:hypothetical protein
LAIVFADATDVPFPSNFPGFMKMRFYQELGRAAAYGCLVDFIVEPMTVRIG